MSGLTTDSAETLAEALEYLTSMARGHDYADDRKIYEAADLIEDALSTTKRHDAEVRAEALRKAADALIPFPDNDYGAFPWGAQKWLRDRAALAEEGER